MSLAIRLIGNACGIFGTYISPFCCVVFCCSCCCNLPRREYSCSIASRAGPNEVPIVFATFPNGISSEYFASNMENDFESVWFVLEVYACSFKKEERERSERSKPTTTREVFLKIIIVTRRLTKRIPSSSKSATTGAPSAAAAADKIITVIHTRITLTTNVIMRKEKREYEDLHLDLLQRLSRRRRTITTTTTTTTFKREERRERSKTPPCS